MRLAAAWLGLGVAAAALGLALDGLGLPSPTLFAGLMAGLAVALARPGALAVPGPAVLAAQALVGVVIGTYLDADSLSVLGQQWLPVTLISAGTLVLSLAAGVALARATHLDRPTAAMGMIAGGASGIVTMARDLGGDERLVAFMQYLRVLVVVVSTPLVLAVAFPGAHTGAPPGGHPAYLGDAEGWVLTVAVAAVGGGLGRLLRIPSPMLLGAMVLAGALTLTDATGDALAVPDLVRDLAFAVIGLQVGLRFTVQTLHEVGRLLLPVGLGIAGLMAGCFGLAAALAATTDFSLLDAYLATTPGGLYAVVAVAFGSGADTTLVVAVQGLRVVVMVLLAPAVVRLLIRERRPVAR